MINKTSLLILFSLVSLCMTSLSDSKISFLQKASNGSHYAVLVAGSNGFWNYRHQSDIFHAYHILVDNGIPKENIIVFAYDDIANDSENPFPGKVFNKPDPTGQGKDVYGGVKIDFKGSDVTPINFLATLTNLKSTENDNVFVYFSDHGATGLIAFPEGELYADDLVKTLTSMSKAKKFNQLVFYLEACESGSMFDKILPSNVKIYATTAANPEQSSWATYCSPDDKVGGKSIGSCLGDEYSVNWLEDSDNSKDLSETLEIQYENVKTKTKNSEVHQYGDLSYVNETIGDFQGHIRSKSFVEKMKEMYEKAKQKIKEAFSPKKEDDSQKKKEEEYLLYLEEAKNSRVNSRDVKLRYLYEKAERKNDLKSQDEYLNELRHIREADSIFKTFDAVMSVGVNVDQINFDCLKSAVKAYKSICQWGEYDLKYVRNIASACQTHTAEEIEETFRKICRN
jgi:legumain